jgi:hypothetical protein
MKKLYAGLAAAALAATGIACTAGTASADPSPAWPSVLGNYTPSTAGAIAVDGDGTVYSASTEADHDTVLHVTTTTPGGTSSPGTVSLQLDPDYTTADISQIALTPTGAVVVLADENDGADNHQSRLWVAPAGADTATPSDADLPVGAALALSPDGAYGVTTNGASAATFTISGSTLTPATAADVAGSADAAAVTDGGTAYLAGYRDDGSNAVWTLDEANGIGDPRGLRAAAESIGVLPGGGVAVGESDDDGNQSLELVDGPHDGATVPLTHEPVFLAAHGSTLWTSNWNGAIATVNLDALGAYSATHQVPTYQGNLDNTYGLGLSADASKLYVAGQTSTYDDNGDASFGPLALYAFAKPGKVSDAYISAEDAESGSLPCVDFTGPAATAGVDLSYVVTATDRSTHAVVSVQGWSNGDGTGTGCFADEDQNSLLSPTHAYDVTVAADNGGILGDTASAGAILPAIAGEGKATISGTPKVGHTLTGAVTGWGSGVSVSYQWNSIESHGESGGPEPIAGQTGRTLNLTAGLLGKRIVLIATAKQKDHADAYAYSQVVTVAAAQTKVTTITAKPVKAGAKKVTLTAPGATSAPGKAKVYEGKKLIGTATIKDGKLVLKLKKKLHKGKHKLTVKYAGSAAVAKFTKTVHVKVK